MNMEKIFLTTNPKKIAKDVKYSSLIKQYGSILKKI